MASTYDSDFSFHEQLCFFYSENRGKIRSRYNDLTRKFLSYNDKDENKNAFLRKPQFEALEMYVFIKEFMNNAQVYELFDDWRNKRNRFSEASYEFSAKDDLVITNKYPGFTPDEVLKSFHADTYCFDSLPEKECFFQYIKSDKVQEVYFTGMFTSNQGDLSVYYYDPESGRIRQYYPDFLAKMKDGTYQLIEVKGDNKIDDVVVQAKKEAALEMAAASGIKYEMYAGSTIMKTHILEDPPVHQTSLLP